MRRIKIIAIIVLVAFVGIQFIQTTRNQSDMVPETDFILVNDAPSDIKSMLQVSCYDCHSNNTQYPWYNKIQPVTWFLENHISDGKAELNFSEWDLLSNRREASKLRSIIKQIEGDEMPLWSYTLIHNDAKFSKEEKSTIIKWITQIKASH